MASLDVAHLRTLEYAGAIRMMRQGLLGESLRTLRALWHRSIEEGNIHGKVYVEEAIAEALVQAGELGQGARAWEGAQTARRGARARLSPRLVSRRARILI